MTKKELIELLAPFPDDTLIVKPGHSDGDGYSDIYELEKIFICEMNSWRGRYAPSDKWNAEEPKIKAIYIN